MTEKPSYQQQVYALTKSLTEDGAIAAIPKIYVKAFGDVNTAYFFSQILYWSDKGKRPDGYFYKTAQDWTDETGLNGYRLQKARKQLEETGLIETRVMRANGSPTVHYRVDQDAVANWISSIAQNRIDQSDEMDFVKSGKSITYTTAEDHSMREDLSADAQDEKPTDEVPCNGNDDNSKKVGSAELVDCPVEVI